MSPYDLPGHHTLHVPLSRTRRMYAVIPDDVTPEQLDYFKRMWDLCSPNLVKDDPVEPAKPHQCSECPGDGFARDVSGEIIGSCECMALSVRQFDEMRRQVGENVGTHQESDER